MIHTKLAQISRLYWSNIYKYVACLLRALCFLRRPDMSCDKGLNKLDMWYRFSSGFAICYVTKHKIYHTASAAHLHIDYLSTSLLLQTV